MLYSNQGRFDQAEPLLQRSLRIGENTLPREHPNIASILNNLAGLYSEQGRHSDAEPMYQRALAIREKAFGPVHPDVATSLENYAILLRKTGRRAEAASLETRAKSIRADSAVGDPAIIHVSADIPPAYLFDALGIIGRNFGESQGTVKLSVKFEDNLPKTLNPAIGGWTDTRVTVGLTDPQKELVKEPGVYQLRIELARADGKVAQFTASRTRN